MLLFLSLKDDCLGYYCVSERSFLCLKKGQIEDLSSPEFSSLFANEDSQCFVFDAAEFCFGFEKLCLAKGIEIPDFQVCEVKTLLFNLSGANREWNFAETLQAMFGKDSPLLSHADPAGEAASLAFLLREAASCFNVSLDDILYLMYEKASLWLQGGIAALQTKAAFDKNIEDVYANLEKKSIQKLLFFDLECANTLDGIGKVCEFGCVVTDMDFNVLERVFLMINPDDRFMLRGRNGAPDLVLAYSERDYYDSPKIGEYEEKIRSLLEDKNTFVAGFAVDNDVSFLATDLDSYGIPQMIYDCFDVQSWVSPEGHSMSLENAYREFVPTEEKASFREHRSVDDAEMTMLVAKHYLKQNEKTLLEVLKERPESLFTSKGYIEYWLARRELPLRRRPKRIVAFPYPSGHGTHSSAE